MAITKPRKTNPSRRKPVKKSSDENGEPSIQGKITSLNSLLEFIAKIEAEHDLSQQQAVISEYAEKVAAAEILSFPVDSNGQVVATKLSPYEKELYERTVSSLITCINSLLKNRKHIKDLPAKLAHTHINSPIVALTYPKKDYKMKYRLRMKYIKG